MAQNPYKCLYFFTTPPKTIQTLRNVSQFCDDCKIRSFTDYLEITEGKITMFADFCEYYRDCKKKKESKYDFGGRCQEFRDICIDYEPCLKVYSLISVELKSIKPDQIIHRNVIFHVVLSVVHWLKFEIRPSSLLNLEMACRNIAVLTFVLLSFYSLTWFDFHEFGKLVVTATSQKKKNQ